MDSRTDRQNEASGGVVTDACLRLLEEGAGSLPREWADLAGRSFVDTVATLLAGANDPAVTAVMAAAELCAGPTRSLATGKSMTPRSAALVDGTSAHALDYDDVDDASISHPSAVLVPALVAAGSLAGSSGQSLARAFRTGLRVSRLLAGVLGVRNHYDPGWHSTATFGTLAAAAATCQLWELSRDTSRHALGIAASLAAGSRQSFGSMVKPLHAGSAAAQGLLAAQLARGGLHADHDLLGGPLGFLALHGGSGRPLRDPASLDTDQAALNTKLFSCCYFTHSAAEAALTLSSSAREESIVRIDAVVQPGCLAPLIHRRPQTSAQAKFSLEYVTAVAVLDGVIGLDTFADERVRRADVQSLLRRVSTTEAATPPVGGAVTAGDYFAVITVTHHDGRVVTARVDAPEGHATRPVSDKRLRAKLDDCVRGGSSRDRDHAFTLLRDIAKVGSARDVVDAVTSLRAERTSQRSEGR